MRPRKTIEVKPLAQGLQRAIQLAETDLERKALCWALEHILFESGNYQGYGYFNAAGKRTREGMAYGEANYYRRHYYGLRFEEAEGDDR